MATKTCTICGTEKPATPEFFADGVTTLDGMRHQCKACRSAKQRAQYAERIGRPVRAQNGEIAGRAVRERQDWKETGIKRCPKCSQRKPANTENFYHSSRRGLSDWCKPCEGQKHKAKRKTLEKFESETHKECTRCRTIKNRSEYGRNARAKDGLALYCKPCYKLILKASREKHGKRWAKEYHKKIKSSPTLTIHYRALGLVRKALDRKGIKERNFSVARGFWAAVGYTRNDLTAHIERQFLPGMTWGNSREWHIDHIVPTADFNFVKMECPEFKACWSLSNLRPLWAADNIAKRANREYLI